MKRGTMEQKERKKYIRDLILVGALLIAALLVLLVIRNRQERETGTDAVVTVRTADGDEVYPLNKDGVFSLNGGTNTLVIENGEAWVSEANCPDKVCMGMGKISKNGEFIACLPNQVIIVVEGGEESPVDIESQIPAFVAVPGVKMGLANIAIVYALYRLGWKEAALISLIRVVLVSLLFGSAASFLYSLAGAVLSLLGMALLKKTGKFTEIVVSVAGGVLHNIGQIAMASIILETDALRYYLPFLLVSGILAGVVIGLISGILIRRIHLS